MGIFTCIEKCSLNKNNVSLESLMDKNKPTTIAEVKGYQLEFAPVGSSLENPFVIISGKTAGYKTWVDFLDLLRRGHSIESAAFQTVYSNMKDNLFRYLNMIKFFDYMKMLNQYWADGDFRTLWNKIFTDETSNNSCGIQLTQACNCSITKDCNSKQPPKSIFNEISKLNPTCLFNNFQISDNLKVIIFLDTPSKDNQFHQIDFFKKTKMYDECISRGVKIISISHPSGLNTIYNDLDRLEELKDTDSKHKNAYMLFKKAKETFELLMDDFNIN